MVPRREAQSILFIKRARLLLNSFKVDRLVYISWDLIIPWPSPGCSNRCYANMRGFLFAFL